jgi:hypothetical protein
MQCSLQPFGAAIVRSALLWAAYGCAGSVGDPKPYPARADAAVPASIDGGSSGDAASHPVDADGGTPRGGSDASGPNAAGTGATDAEIDAATTDGAAPKDAGPPDAGPIDSGVMDDGGPIGDPTGVTAVPARDFLNSIGVCTHVGQGVDNAAKCADAMAFAGIRNFRDDGSQSAVAGWIAMSQSAGVRLDLLPNLGIPTTIDMAKQLRAAGALLAIEGPNEPNNFPVTYQNQTSSSATTFLPVAKFQRDLYAAVKAEPTLQDIPIFHSSEAGGSQPDNLGLQFLLIPNGQTLGMPSGTRYADYANTHNYVCGHNSELVDNVTWKATDRTLNGDWDSLYVEYARTWAKGFVGLSNAELEVVPWVTTETGWVTSGAKSITEEQQARVFLNLYLSAFKHGIAYTFIYMLRDDPGQGYWGLFDVNYQPKKSGTYLHNFTTILADTGTRPAGKLNYAITPEPATLHALLLQKHTGQFALAIWNDRPSGGSDAVTVDLGASRPNVNVYDPTLGTTAMQTLRDVSSVSLTLTDHPVVVELELSKP